MDPTGVEFVASIDHDALAPNGAPIVYRYDLYLYVAGSSSPTSIVPLGKPSPDDDGRIHVPLAAVFNPLPPGGPTYEVRIAAVGSGGSALSDPSNPFSFQVVCSYNVSPANRTVDVDGGTVSFSVTTPSGCAWTSWSDAGWIALAGSGAGVGSGTATFSVANNPGAGSRSGSVIVAGQAASVSQPGIACAFTVSPTSRTLERSGGVVHLAVAAPPGCVWSATEQASWLTISEGASGSGDGTVTISVAANSSLDARSATVTVAGRSIVFAQEAASAPAPPRGMRIIGH